MTNAYPYPSAETRVTFEPGSHILSEEEFKEVEKRFKAGDMNASVWNQAPGERIAVYRPSLIAFDSGPSPQADEKDLELRTKLAYRLAMPGDPGRLFGGSGVYAVAGDVDYGAYGNLAANILYAGDKVVLLGTAYQAGKVAEVGFQKYESLVKGYDNVSGAFDQEVASAVPRRKFLRFATTFTTLSALAARSNIAGYITRPATIHAAEDVTDAISHIEPSHYISGGTTNLDGRTALLVEKSNALLDMIPGLVPQKASVLMGTYHMASVRDTLQSTEHRHQRIVDIAEQLIALAASGEPFYTNEKTAHTTKDARIAGVKQQLSSAGVVRIDAINSRRFQANPMAEVNRTVKLMGVVEIPTIAKIIARL